MRVTNFLATVPFLITLNACSWVELNEAGEKVRVLSEEEVTKCEYKGKSTVSVTEKLAGVRRHDKSIQQELIILARNGAKNLDGDTVVPVSEESEGKRSFKVYRCVPR